MDISPTPQKRGRGRPPGTSGGGRYGCKTKVVRVPETIANNIDAILSKFEEIKSIVDFWEDDSEFKTSPRYDKAKRILHDLRACLDD